jgi:cholesterol transport system auxiliary component
MKRGGLSALAGTLLLAGCGFLQPVVEPPMTMLLLDRMPADVPRAARQLPASLLVYPPQAGPLVDTTRMAYTLRPHHLAYYSQNEWAESPPRMLHPLLVRVLDATGRFTSVLVPPRSGAAAYALRSEVLELVQDYTQDPPVVRLVLRLQLADERGNRGVGTREIRVQEALREKTPYAGVAAANAAVVRALREVAGFVVESTP